MLDYLERGTELRLDYEPLFAPDGTAEGVETADQYEKLVGMGCGELQGYLLSRPLSVDRLRALCPPKMEDVRLRPTGWDAGVP